MSTQDNSSDKSNLLLTPLNQLHRQLGARMVEFAGYDMPVQFAGIIKEHNFCRSHSCLFDVSHMGQIRLSEASFDHLAAAMEIVVPSSIRTLKPGQMRYTVLLNDQGGVIDDLIITRPPADASHDQLWLIVNASRQHYDYSYMTNRLPRNIKFELLTDVGLLALQGPMAAKVISTWLPEATKLQFMTCYNTTFIDMPVSVSRSGYTGEDGFELAMTGEHAVTIAKELISHPDVEAAGLGARDILRLEAGLCLYGHELDEKTSPVEADINFILTKSRLETCDFPGAARIISELENGPVRKRVGLVATNSRLVGREGATVKSPDGAKIGIITSGGFSPTRQAPIAMAYINHDWLTTSDGTVVMQVRDNEVTATITKMPFVNRQPISQ